jgi:hypothetical protein
MASSRDKAEEGEKVGERRLTGWAHVAVIGGEG